MTARRLLALTAHPDDEGFGLAGTMARYAADGWQVTLVCATRGEVGEISDPALATPETLPTVRVQELRDACAELGVSDVRLLDYRDSGMAGTPENADPRALSNADPEAVIAVYDALLRDLKPAIVITWDASGGYGHPDHISVHKYATEATRRAIEAGHGPAALYWMTAPMEKFAEMARALEEQGVHMISDEMRDEMLRLPHVEPTTAIDVRAFLPQKLASMARHRTQMAEQGPFALLPPTLRDEIMATEHFHRVLPPLPPGAPEEHALLEELAGNSGPQRHAYGTGRPMETRIGFSRAVRYGDVIEVSGTAPTDAEGAPVAPGDAYAQTKACLEIVGQALAQLGGSLADVVRTRMFITDVSRWEEVGRAHGDVFRAIRPAATMVGVAALLHPDWLVEIEATAIVGSASATAEA